MKCFFVFMKMLNLQTFPPSDDVVVSFDLRTMRTSLKLPKGDLESMHAVLKCVGMPNNKVISQL